MKRSTMRDNLAVVFGEYGASPFTAMVLAIYMLHAGEDGVAFPSHAEIARRMSRPGRPVHRKSVDRAVSWLKKHGFLEDVGGVHTQAGKVKKRRVLTPNRTAGTSGTVAKVHPGQEAGSNWPACDPQPCGGEEENTERTIKGTEKRSSLRDMIDRFVADGHVEAKWTESNARERIDAGWPVDLLEVRVRQLLADGVEFSQAFSKASVGPPDPNEMLVRSSEAIRARAAEVAGQAPSRAELQSRQEANEVLFDDLVSRLAGNIADG